MSLALWKTEVERGSQRWFDAVADELCRQAADIAAAEYRWLRLLAEFDEAGGWAVGGAKTCAAWLFGRVG